MSAKASQCRTTTSWIETLDWVVQQDVDFIDVGHYSPATKADEVALRAYMVDLHQQVLDLVRAGQSWDQLYRNVHFSDEVKKWIASMDIRSVPACAPHSSMSGGSLWADDGRVGRAVPKRSCTAEALQPQQTASECHAPG